MFNSPPDELRLETNYNSVYSALGAAALIITIAAFGVWMGGGGWQELTAMFVILGVIWGGIALVFGWANRRRVRRERRDALALFEGEQWAVWQWPPDAWQRELTRRRADHERQTAFQRRWTPWLSLLAALIIGGSALLPLLMAGDAMPPQARVFLVGLAIVLVLLVGVLQFLGGPRHLRRLQSRLEWAEQAAAPHVRFGPYGLYHDTDGHTWLRALTGVSYSTADGRLTFRVRRPGPRGGTLYQAVHVPVPEGLSAEAEALARRYRSERKLRG